MVKMKVVVVSSCNYTYAVAMEWYWH